MIIFFIVIFINLFFLFFIIVAEFAGDGELGFIIMHGYIYTLKYDN